jgi:hypothetical protein
MYLSPSLLTFHPLDLFILSSLQLPSSLPLTLRHFAHSRSSVPVFLSYLYLLFSFVPYSFPIISVCASYYHT